MSEEDKDYDSDAPEELTAQQGIQQDTELRKVEKEEKARVVREGKERRRQWAQKKTPKKKPKVSKAVVDAEISHKTYQGTAASRGMLPDDIVQLLAAREKQVFASDSEDEDQETVKLSKKKRRKSSGLEPVILKEIPPPQCLQASLEFLKKQKMQLTRSSSVLNNSSQALRLLSGLLKNKPK